MSMTNEQILERLRNGIGLSRKGCGELADILESNLKRGVVPEGMALVPAKMSLSSDALQAIEFACGGDRDSDDVSDHWLDGALWVGAIKNDDGTETHGLHLYSYECPEEGSVTLAEFPA